jgi:predicted secreted protein
MTASFVPQNYVAPTAAGGDFTKLQDGENRLRILSEMPTIGYVYWNNAGKPVRSEQHPGQPADVRIGQDGKPEKVKEFWAVAVYNYGTKKVELWEFTQAGIRDGLISLAQDPEWGHPTQYGIKVTKSGKGLDTKYAVLPGKAADLTADVQAVVDASTLNVRAVLGLEPAHPAPGAAPTAEQAKVLAPVDDSQLPF